MLHGIRTALVALVSLCSVVLRPGLAMKRVRHRWPLAIVAAVGAMLPPSMPTLALAGGLVLAGLTQQGICATLYYVDGALGSDANPGTNPNLPRKTAPASVASGDVVYLSGAIRSSTTPTGSATGGAALLSYSGVSNVTIQQWTGMPQAELRGDYQLLQTGWVASGNAWKKTIATGLTIDAAAYKWDANTVTLRTVTVNAGHLVLETVLGNVTGAGPTGGVGRYNYDSGTGVFTVYLGGDNPNTSGYPVSVIVIGGTFSAAIEFIGGSGNVVNGVNFALYACQSNTGWGVKFTRSPTCTAINCQFRDMGGHAGVAYGSGGDSSNCMFVNCTAYGGWEQCAYFVHYQDAASGAMTRGRRDTCSVYAYRFLGTDGNVRLAGGGTMAGNTQIGFYAHSDSGTTIADLLDAGCSFYNLDDGCTPADADNVPSPADGYAWSGFAYRIDQMRVYSGATWRIGGNRIAVRRSIIGMTRSGASALNRYGSAGVIGQGTTNTGIRLFESCAFIFDGTDPGFTTMNFVVYDAAHDLRLVNCSIWEDTAANNTVMFDWGGSTTTFIRAKGCAIGFRTGSATTLLCYDDTTTNAAHHDFTDNAYYNISAGRWSLNASYDTQAEWLASVDTAMVVLAIAPFPNAPTDLSLSDASSLWTIRRATRSIVPTVGINDYYDEHYGAYFYPRLPMHVVFPVRLQRRLA